MNPKTRQYLHGLELAALGAAIPVVLDLLQQPHLDAKTAIKSVVTALLTGAWAFFRSNPPPSTP